FFFQAEDGIRDLIVTGVQTCALPISASPEADRSGTSWFSGDLPQRATVLRAGEDALSRPFYGWAAPAMPAVQCQVRNPGELQDEIGRASCRERVRICGGGVSL